MCVWHPKHILPKNHLLNLEGIMFTKKPPRRHSEGSKCGNNFKKFLHYKEIKFDAEEIQITAVS